MPELDLDELERLHAEATPGPWRVESEVCRDSMGLLWPITSIEGAEDNVTENVTTGDAAYIVAACNAAPELIAENRALKEKVRELERQKRVLVEKMAIDILCSECPVSEACPYENATFIDLEDCAKQLEKWSENAAKEAGEDAAIVG